MWSRIVSAVLCTSLLFSLSGCGGETEEDDNTTQGAEQSGEWGSMKWGEAKWK